MNLLSNFTNSAIDESKPKKRPEIIVEYAKYMGGVDKFDQLKHMILRGDLMVKMHVWLFIGSEYNAYTLYKSKPENNKCIFRVRIIEGSDWISLERETHYRNKRT